MIGGDLVTNALAVAVGLALVVIVVILLRALAPLLKLLLEVVAFIGALILAVYFAPIVAGFIVAFAALQNINIVLVLGALLVLIIAVSTFFGMYPLR
ncbi:MAG: hypothetical protein M5U01_03720 [Ardenticatenaceae bacterium]|nr:hypothetical protein [Ardenticatenaceae bacterium]